MVQYAKKYTGPKVWNSLPKHLLNTSCIPYNIRHLERDCMECLMNQVNNLSVNPRFTGLRDYLKDITRMTYIDRVYV